MEFRLLGLLEVVADDGPVRIVRGRESALLALLLLRSNQPLSTDRIVEELWGAAAPENAAKSVHIYVSRLRKALGADRIETTSAGYRMRVESGELDCERFYRYAAEGRRQEALALWRGEPLADFRFEAFAQSEIRRLAAVRDDLWMDELDARIDAGSVAEAIPELRALVEREPLWERPRGQLMRALYLAGRQSEALELYRSTRTLLSDELGIEPSIELKQLEQAILNQDPALGSPPSLPRRIASRRSGKILLAAGLVTLLAALVGAWVLDEHGGGGIDSLAPSSIGIVDAASSHIDAQIAIPGQPTKLAGSGGAVWVGFDESRTLAAVDPGTKTVGRIRSVAAFPSAIAAGVGYVWLLDGSSGLLTAFDPTYGVARKRVRIAAPNPVYDESRESLDENAVAVGLGSVWVTDGSPKLIRVDPRSRRLRPIDVQAPLTGVAVGEGAVWAISGPDSTVFRISPSGEVTRIPIASRPDAESPFPLAIAVGAGSVWVLNANTATVTKIDPAQRLVLDTKNVGVEHRPVAIAAGDGAAWVAGADGSLIRINAASGAIQLLRTGGSLRDVAVVGKDVWVTAGAGALAAPSAVQSAPGTRALPPETCSPVYSSSGTRPQYLIASDLALQGSGGGIGAQIEEAIQFELARRDFRAGRFVVGYQSCDDSAPATGLSLARCAANAHMYARDPSLIALIGTEGSECTSVELPITNRAGLTMVSPSDTDDGLTHRGPGTAPGEPARYSPTARRTYARVIASNDEQGAADALVASQLGAHRVVVLEDATGYGYDMAAGFAQAARRLRLTVSGPRLWSYQAKSYAPLVASVAAAHPDAVFLGTFLAPETVQLIRVLRTMLPHTVRLLAPDGFPPAKLVADVGSDAEGMMASAPGLPPSQLPPGGRSFVAAFKRATGNGPPSPFAIAAAQATDVVLDAIARSDGSRGSVRMELFKTHITSGILGTFGFDRNGDTTAPSVTVYRVVRGKPTVFKVVTPRPTLTH